MLKRLGLGLLIGIVLGGLLGYGLGQVPGALMGGALGYVFAAVTGVLVGLVAGKPIWAKGAGVEAGLKAGIGALLGCALLFGLRFLSFNVPSLAGIADAPIGRHPIGALVAISTLLAVFYEIDNSGGDDEKDIEKHAPTRKRVDGGPVSKKGAALADDESLEDEAPAKKKGKA
jgi:hypothetical protein